MSTRSATVGPGRLKVITATTPVFPPRSFSAQAGSAPWARARWKCRSRSAGGGTPIIALASTASAPASTRYPSASSSFATIEAVRNSVQAASACL